MASRFESNPPSFVVPDVGDGLPATEFFSIMSAFPTGAAIVTTLDADGTARG